MLKLRLVHHKMNVNAVNRGAWSSSQMERTWATLFLYTKLLQPHFLKIFFRYNSSNIRVWIRRNAWIGKYLTRVPMTKGQSYLVGTWERKINYLELRMELSEMLVQHAWSHKFNFPLCKNNKRAKNLSIWKFPVT